MDGKEVDLLGELANIGRMKSLRAKGFSYWKIADILNSMGVPNKMCKGVWSAKQVHQILERVGREALGVGENKGARP